LSIADRARILKIGRRSPYRTSAPHFSSLSPSSWERAPFQPLNLDISSLALLEPVFLPLVKVIQFGGPYINDFWTAISVFFLNGALLAIERIRYSYTTA